MTWVQVCDLGAISTDSRCEIHFYFRCRRDCAEIAYLHPGHLEALQAGGGRRAPHGDIRNARDRWVATISARMAVFTARGLHGSLGALARTSSKRAWNSHAPHAAIFAEIVATQPSRALWISPRHSLCPPLDCNFSRWPGCRYAISAQSRLHLKGISHLEIAPRLRTCTQATQRRYTVADRAEHATEISGLPGFDRWRRSRRERWPDYDACRQRLFDKISNLKSYGKYNHSRPFRPAGSNPPTTDTSMDPFAIVYP